MRVRMEGTGAMPEGPSRHMQMRHSASCAGLRWESAGSAEDTVITRSMPFFSAQSEKEQLLASLPQKGSKDAGHDTARTFVVGRAQHCGRDFSAIAQI